MSKRSPIVLVLAGGLFTDGVEKLGGGGEAAEEKSPKSPPKLSSLGAGTGWGGEVGLGGAAGFVSKNEPPLSAGGFEEVDAALFWPVGAANLENGAGFAC